MKEVQLKARSTGGAFVWLRQGWGMFRANVGPWIGFALIWLGAVYLASFVSGFAFALIAPLLLGGFMLGCAAQTNGKPLSFEHLAAVCRGDMLWRLLGVGAVLIAGIVIVNIFELLIDLLQLIQFVNRLDDMSRHNSMADFHLFSWRRWIANSLISIIIYLPLVLVLMFAPALIVHHDLGTKIAVKQSLSACLRNPTQIILFGVISMFLIILTIFTLFFGLLIVVPVLVASLYAAYLDLFERTPEPVSD